MGKIIVPDGWESAKLLADLSHFDVVDSLAAMMKDGVEGFILKLGQGAIIDKAFPGMRDRLHTIEGSSLNAVYWFLDPGVSAVSQSALISLHRPSGAGLYFDLESTDEDPAKDRWLDMKLEARQALLGSVVGRYKAETGVHPGLYVTADYWLNVFGAPDGYEACPWWGPRYGDKEPVQPKNLGPWVGWQFTEYATVGGVEGSKNVDLSVFRS